MWAQFGFCSGVLGLVAGMGTKLHSKAYFPGYYSRDLSNAGNGMWAVFDDGKSFQNGQVNDSFLASSTVDRYIGYNKEKVRQTILKHESVFREQLQELHRLYRRQRELMNELGRRESHKSLLPAEISNPSLLTLQNSFKDDNNVSRVSDSYMVNGKLSSHDRIHLKDYEFPKPEYRFQKKMFELEVNDEGKQGERIYGVEGKESFPLEKNYSSLSKLDMNLCPGSVSNGQSDRDANRFVSNSKINNKLVDLNEPILVEESSTSDPVRNVEISINLREDIKERDIRSCLGEQDGRNVFNTIQSESVKNGNWNLAYNSKAGHTRLDQHTSLGKITDERLSTFFEISQDDPRENHDPLKLFVCDQSNETPQRMKTIFGVQVSGGNLNRSTNTCYSPSSRPLIQRSNAMDSELSCISPRRKAHDNSGHRTLSSFTGRPPSSAMQMPGLSGDKSTNNLRLRPGSNLGASHHSAICFGSQSSVKQHGYLDLNTYVAAASNFQNKVVAQQDSVFADTRNHSTDKQIKTEVMYQMSLDSLQTRSHHFFNNAKITKGPFMNSTSATCDSDSERKRTSDCNSGNKMSGVPTVHVPHFPKVLISPLCPSKPIHNVSILELDGSSKVFTQNIKSVSQHEETYSIANNGRNNHFSVLRPEIDLNLTLDEQEPLSMPSVPAAVVKIPATEIDLEAPEVIGSITDVSFETDLLQKKTEKCSGVSLDDKYDELSRIAAEAIINISSSQFDLLDSTCQPTEALPPTRLLWLSEVISSYEGSDHESKITKVGLTKMDDTSDEETVPRGMDYFEFMTLNLQETKVEDYCTHPYVLDNRGDEDTTVTSAAKRGRKRQAKRGRQLRDFQRDVLPGLVSLSRREVTEDLQTIEEIFKASGQTWQSSFSQRRAGRNGRGRKRLVDLAPPQTATLSCPPPPVQQPTCRELEDEDRNLTGWGKRTRRLPRQRCSANHSAILNC